MVLDKKRMDLILDCINGVATDFDQIFLKDVQIKEVNHNIFGEIASFNFGLLGSDAVAAAGVLENFFVDVFRNQQGRIILCGGARLGLRRFFDDVFGQSFGSGRLIEEGEHATKPWGFAVDKYTVATNEPVIRPKKFIPLDRQRVECLLSTSKKLAQGTDWERHQVKQQNWGDRALEMLECWISNPQQNPKVSAHGLISFADPDKSANTTINQRKVRLALAEAGWISKRVNQAVFFYPPFWRWSVRCPHKVEYEREKTKWILQQESAKQLS